MKYAIAIKPVEHQRRLDVCHALRWGLGGPVQLMTLKQAHDFVINGGVVATFSAHDNRGIEYAAAIEQAGASVDIEEQP